MEQTQLETLRSLASLFPLPQHRSRRLLKSETCSTLVRMHSLFHEDSRPTNSNKTAEEVSERALQNGKDEEKWTKTIENTCSTSLETENFPIQKEAHACVNVDSNVIGDSENYINCELIQDAVNELGVLMEDGKKKPDDNSYLGSNQENENIGIDPDIENENGKDFNKKNDSFPTAEAVAPSWDMDSMFECLMHDEKDDERSSIIEQKISHEIWQEDSLELEKFLSCSNLNELSHKNVIDEEMEEGEILYEVGDLDQPLDSILDESGLSENMKDNEGLVDVEPLTSNNTNDINQKDLRSNESMPEKGRNLNFDYKADDIDFPIAAVVSKNQATTMPHVSDNPESHVRILEEIVAETETAGTVEQVAVIHKKRKRSTESKQKKKKKERLKRAENNRRLGVKRLKIVPISKPKAIVYCRHFVKGRCHEGENCKFSHDTVPLTKSQPCCYFARHTCMKGDDCPFDHELSKYPCNNHVSKGYCGRGADCMFSHQVPPKNNSSETTTTELKPSGSLENKGSQKQSNAPIKKIEKADSETVLKHSVKGIDKLLFGIGSPHNHSIGPDLTGPCIENHGSKAQTIPITNVVTESRRINFLSFGKSPMNDLKTNGSSNLFNTTRDDVSTNIEVAASSLLQNEGLSCQNEMPEKTTTQKWLPRGINFMSFGAGQTTASQENHGKKGQAIPISNALTESRRVNFLSFGKSPVHDLKTNGSSNLFYTSRDDVSTNIAAVASSLQQKGESCQHEIPEKPTTQTCLPRGINFMPFGAGQTTSHDMNVLDKKILQMPVDIGKGSSCPASKPPEPLPSTSMLATKGYRSNSSQNALTSMLAFAEKYQSKIKTVNRAGNGPTKGS